MKSLYSLKPWFSRLLKPVLKASIRAKISPDVYTLLNVVFGALAGLAATWLNGWLVLLFVLLRLACANLDGALARALQALNDSPPKKSGFTKNEIGDRLADFGMLFGLFYLAGQKYSLTALLAILVAAVPTVISLIGVSKGLARINSGPFGKTERCFATVLIVFIAGITSQVEQTVYIGSIVIIVGSLITAWSRYLKIIKS